jgi:hypothetical protein
MADKGLEDKMRVRSYIQSSDPSLPGLRLAEPILYQRRLSSPARERSTSFWGILYFLTSLDSGVVMASSAINSRVLIIPVTSL